MSFVPQLLTLSVVVLLACISPGPDFIAVTSHALASRSRGLGVASGVALACAVWAALAMFGLGLLLEQIAWLYMVIRVAGAAYLVYLGAKMLLGARRPAGAMPASAAKESGSAIRIGFTVGMTNPKSAAFFGSLFVTILPVGAPVLVQGAAVVLVAVVALVWFFLLALMFSAGRVRSAYATVRRPIDAVMGAVLLGLQARLATTH